MRSTVKILFCLPLALSALMVHAQIYICKDAGGRTITSDRPIPECSDRQMRELGNSGLTIRQIPAPLTAEQKRQNQLLEQKRKSEEDAAEEQRRQDRAIVARYRNEKEIDAARKRTIELMQEQIKLEESTLALAEQRLKDAQAQSDAQKTRKELRRKVDDAAQAVKDEKGVIGDRQNDIAQTNAKFDQTVKRFRELTGSSESRVDAK